MAAVLVAALGTGLNTAVFAVAYGILLRPLPYRDAARLAVVDVAIPLARVDEWRRQLSTFEYVAAYARGGLAVHGLTEARFLPVAMVDEEFFATLGTQPIAGTVFGGTAPLAVAVISDRLARQTRASRDSLQAQEMRRWAEWIA